MTTPNDRPTSREQVKAGTPLSDPEAPQRRERRLVSHPELLAMDALLTALEELPADVAYRCLRHVAQIYETRPGPEAGIDLAAAIHGNDQTE